MSVRPPGAWSTACAPRAAGPCPAATAADERFEVLRSGRLVYKLDDSTENAFELRALAEYKDRAVPRRRRAEWLRETLRR